MIVLNVLLITLTITWMNVSKKLNNNYKLYINDCFDSIDNGILNTNNIDYLSKINWLWMNRLHEYL